MKKMDYNNKIIIHIDNFNNLPVFLYENSNLKEKYEFIYSNDTTINDLFDYLASNMYPGEYERLKNTNRLFTIKVMNEYWHVQKDYKLSDFIKNNELDIINIFGVYGIGAGTFINEINASIYINPNEGKHKHNPHVHIYRGTGKVGDCARISLKNMTHMKGSKLNDLFSKKEEKIIFEILLKYQNELIDYYNKVQLGMYPEPIDIVFNNKTIFFH